MGHGIGVILPIVFRAKMARYSWHVLIDYKWKEDILSIVVNQQGHKGDIDTLNTLGQVYLAMGK